MTAIKGTTAPINPLHNDVAGAIVPFIAVMTDVVMRNNWRHILVWRIASALLPAIVIYLIPFVASTYFGVITIIKVDYISSIAKTFCATSSPSITKVRCIPTWSICLSILCMGVIFVARISDA